MGRALRCAGDRAPWLGAVWRLAVGLTLGGWGCAAALADAPGERETDLAGELRPRGGVLLGSGMLYYPKVNLGVGHIRLEGELGVQIDDRFGLFLAPSVGLGLAEHLYFGSFFGVAAGVAAIAEVTFNDQFSVGAGPEVLDLGVRESRGLPFGGSGVVLTGGRIYLAPRPLLVRAEDGVTRKALTTGVELRLLTGPVVRSERSPREVGPREVVGALAFRIGYSVF